MACHISLKGANNEGSIRRSIAGKIAQLSSPPVTKVELFLTERCTLHCDYCFVANKNATKRMSLEIAQTSIDYLMEHSLGKQELSITFLEASLYWNSP